MREISLICYCQSLSNCSLDLAKEPFSETIFESEFCQPLHTKKNKNKNQTKKKPHCPYFFYYLR